MTRQVDVLLVDDNQADITLTLRALSDEITKERVRLLLRNNRQILLIEDSKFMRVAIDRALRAVGYIVNTASDGEEGLRMARGHDQI